MIRAAYICLVLDDDGEEHEIVIAGVFNGMTVAAESGHAVACADIEELLVILNAAAAFHEVEQLGFTFVNMIADGCAGDQRQNIKNAGFLGQLTGKVGKLDIFFSAAHVLADALILVAFAGNHMKIPPSFMTDAVQAADPDFP